MEFVHTNLTKVKRVVLVVLPVVFSYISYGILFMEIAGEFNLTIEIFIEIDRAIVYKQEAGKVGCHQFMAVYTYVLVTVQYRCMFLRVLRYIEQEKT